MQEETNAILILEHRYSETQAMLYAMIEAGRHKVDEMVVFGGTKGYSGRILDLISFDEIANIQLEVPPVPKITYGPERKGKKKR